MKEYRMTFMWRILTLIVFLPLGVLLMGVSLEKTKWQVQLSPLLIIACGLFFFVAIVWIYSFKKKIVLNGNNINVLSLFGEDSINISGNTKFKHHSIQIHAGLVGGVLHSISEEATTHINIVIEDDETKIKLNSNIKGIGDLRDKLVHQELEKVCPALYANYRSGKAVNFGSLTLHNGNIEFKNKSISLKQIENTSFNNGRLVISIKNERKYFAKIKTQEITNLHSFFKILNDIRKT